MSRKRKNADVEGESSSSGSRRNSKGNDSKNRSKKQAVDHTVKSSKYTKKQQLRSAVEQKPVSLEGGGGGDTPWSKSKKKRMRLLKGKLLKKEQDPVPNAADAARVSPSGKNASITCPKGASPKQQQQQQKAKPMTGTSESQTQNDTSADSPAAALPLPPPPRGSSALQEAFKARLSGSRFRILNEELYTTTSATAFERFSAHPELYDEYHDGFRSQVEHWPVNPVDVIVGRLKKEVDIFVNNRTDTKQQETPNRINIENNKQIVVADFGCGDAALAKQLLKVQIPIQQQEGRKRKKGGGTSSSNGDDKSETTTTWCPFRVHSFDLVSQSDLVTACDMSNVPLPSASVDCAVFCLSLMGTNLADFVREAHRVLKSSGRLKIAEVKSRFSSSSTTTATSSLKKKSRNSSHNKNKNDDDTAAGQDEEREFIQVLKKLGFECTRTDRSNKMFVLFELRKNGKNPDRKVEYTAKPCIYKRR